MELLKKLIQFAMGNGIVMILGFISSPIITSIIDTDNMGKFSMFNTLIPLLTYVALLGINQSYVRYYYDETEECRGRLLRQCIKMVSLSIGAVSVVILIFYKQISTYLIGEASMTVALMAVIFLIINAISTFAFLEIRMKQKAKLYSSLCIVLKLGYLGGIGIFYAIFRNSYITLVLATILGTLISVLLSLWIERKVWFGKFKAVAIKTTNKSILKYGMPFIFSMTITWVFQSIDKITIRGFTGYSEVGLYTGAMLIVNLLNSLQGTFTTFWTPVAYKHYTDDPEDKDFFIRINEIVSVVMLVGAVGLIMVKDVIILILGESYRSAVFIFPYLVFMPIMNCISETTVMGINFKKKSKNHIYIALISAISNLLGNIILVPRFGATGAAISTGLSYVIFFIARTYMSNRYYKVDYKLKKFFISVASIYVLAAYSSFNRFNIIIFVLSIGSILLILMLYRDIIKYMVLGIKNRKRENT